MYKLNSALNTIQPLESKKFSELGFSERKHLQEWLESCPEALNQGGNDELLIIQKEFAGFEDTKERLDLLAMDKQGNLVIIENKLDDSGRDVVWQALKYASYCANLSKSHVVEMYQQYLNQKAAAQNKEPMNAEKSILEFLDEDDFSSLQINRYKTQRLILVALKYRKEVTNTVLWLSHYGLSCQCFKVTPYQSDEDIYLSVDQIIPTPELKDFMIGMVAKDTEERSADDEQITRYKIRLEFWSKALSEFSKSECTLFNNISPSRDHWLSAGSGLSSMPFNLIFGKNEARVEFSMQRAEADQNQAAYDVLLSHKDEIESEFGSSLAWLPLPQKKSCRVQYAMPISGYEKDNWDTIIKWMIEHMCRLERAIRPHFQAMLVEMKKV